MHISACILVFILLSLFNLSNPSFIIHIQERRSAWIIHTHISYFITFFKFTYLFFFLQLYLLTDKVFFVTARISACKKRQKKLHIINYIHTYNIYWGTHVRGTHNEFNSIYRLRELKYICMLPLICKSDRNQRFTCTSMRM